MLENYEKIESTNIDFKEEVEYKKPKSWLKTVSAFANTSGGIILFGIRDNDRKLVGLKDIIKDSEKLSELVNARIVPLPSYYIKSLMEDNKYFIELSIDSGSKTPYYYDGDGRREAFIRAGNESIPAPKHILDDLILKGQNLAFDELPSKYKKDDVSFTLLNATFKKETGKGLDNEKDYLSLGLMTQDGHVTNGGLLLSDQVFLTHSRIFCTRWKGLKKGSVDIDALDDKEYSGNLITLLENAETFVKNNTKVSWKIEGLRRVESHEYPRDAVREAIVNAIIHRDYHIIGSEIHIDMFDDRLEITSPGGMMDGSLIQNKDIISVSSMRRNKVISDIFGRIDFMERRGSGLVKILESYDDFNIKPEFDSSTSTFRVIFPNKVFERGLSKKETSVQDSQISEEEYFIIKMHRLLPKNIKEKTKEFIKLLFDKYSYDYDFKRSDLREMFNLRNSRVTEIIKLLLDSTLIERSGHSKYRFKR